MENEVTLKRQHAFRVKSEDVKDMTEEEIEVLLGMYNTIQDCIECIMACLACFCSNISLIWKKNNDYIRKSILQK